MYVARPVAEVRYGSSTWHHGFVVLLRRPPAGTMAVLDVLSGMSALTPQESVSLRPVLVPPCTVSPFLMRALTPKSKPCQLLVMFAPATLESSWRLRTWPTLLGFKSKSPETVCPPPPGSLGSSGAAMLNGV